MALSKNVLLLCEIIQKEKILLKGIQVNEVRGDKTTFKTGQPPANLGVTKFTCARTPSFCSGGATATAVSLYSKLNIAKETRTQVDPTPT